MWSGRLRVLALVAAALAGLAIWSSLDSQGICLGLRQDRARGEATDLAASQDIVTTLAPVDQQSKKDLPTTSTTTKRKKDPPTTTTRPSPKKDGRTKRQPPSGAYARERELSRLLDRMDLPALAAQLVQCEQADSRRGELAGTSFGAAYFSGETNPGEDDEASWRTESARLQKEALLAEPHHIPVLVGVDAVHGMSHMRGATIFPHNLALGCTHNEALIEEIGRITAVETSSVGVNFGYAPCVALVTDVRWGRTYESFGQDPDYVGRLGAAYVRGATSAGVPFLTCGKHWVADGGTRYGSGRIAGRPFDRGDWSGSMEELRRTHMKPYDYLIGAGVQSMMVSFSSVNGTLNHGHRSLLTGELKQRLGFRGFVSSDFGAVSYLHPDFSTALQMALNAGLDLVMIPPSNDKNPTPAQLQQRIVNLVAEGRVPLHRVKDAARRVLWGKFASGLMARPASRGDVGVVGNVEHRLVAQQAAAGSVVILKNRQDILPLSLKRHRLCVAGSAANNPGMHAGGWTLNWQGGKDGFLNTRMITVWQGVFFRALGLGLGSRVKLEASGECHDSDVVLLVVGEVPYAEFFGDVHSLPKPADLSLVEKIKQRGLPLILLSIAGRPIDIEAHTKVAAAVVASFLPGSEGGHGIADVLLGGVAPTGRLSIDWPRSGHSRVGPTAPAWSLLYRNGFGLTWAVKSQVASGAGNASNRAVAKPR